MRNLMTTRRCYEDDEGREGEEDNANLSCVVVCSRPRSVNVFKVTVNVKAMPFVEVFHVTSYSRSRSSKLSSHRNHFVS
jgi:hypothetical protein